MSVKPERVETPTVTAIASGHHRHPLRSGFKLVGFFPLEVRRASWSLAEDLGFDHCWENDHLVATGTGSDPMAPVFESWAVLAAMAEATRRIRIGVLVTGNLYRHPGLLGKLAVTVDHLSRGRLEVGLGAAWNEAEFAMLGMDFPPPRERVGRLDEACMVLRKLWTEERASFAGRYYTLTDAIAEPKPVQRPHPPIWIGGSGPRRTLRIAAKHAGVWNMHEGSRSTLEHALEVSATLDAHCRAIGRDPSTLRRSVQFMFTSVDEALRKTQMFTRAGFSEHIFMLGGPDPLMQAELVAQKVLPELRAADERRQAQPDR